MVTTSSLAEVCRLDVETGPSGKKFKCRFRVSSPRPDRDGSAVTLVGSSLRGPGAVENSPGPVGIYRGTYLHSQHPPNQKKKKRAIKSIDDQI